MTDIVFWDAIIPTKIDMDQITGEIEEALYDVAALIEEDLEEPTGDWERQVDFETIGPDNGVIIVMAEDEVYAWVNDGTKAHRIEPRDAPRLVFLANFSPKTTVGSLRSGPGGSSLPIVFSTGVNHPGNEPRHFDELTVDDVQPKFTKLVQKALTEGAKKAGLR